MYPSTPVHLLLCEAGLSPASILLDYRQRLYIHRLFSLPDLHPTKQILPISSREGDRGFQSRELPENTLIQTENVWPKYYGQWLAWQIPTDHSIDSAKGVELVTKITSHNLFKPQVIVKSKKEAMKEAKKDYQGQVFWTDRSKLDQGQAATAVSWEEKSTVKQKEKSMFLGKNKEILNAELWAILEALVIAGKMANSQISVIILSDSQKALRAIVLPFTFQENRYLRSQVYQKTEKLQQSGHPITFQWIPTHFSLIENEKANLLA